METEMKAFLTLVLLLLGTSCGINESQTEKERKKDIKKKWYKSVNKKKAKKNWKKLKNSLKIVNKFKPAKRLPKEITSQRGRFFNLKEIRNVIKFPKYTAKEKVTLVNQVQNVLLNHYVNLQVKIDDFGNNADPTLELKKLKALAKDLPEEELHRRIGNLFLKLRDGHLNYILPIPHACFESYLPFSFAYAKNGLNEEKVILTEVKDFTKYLAKGISHSNFENFKKLKAGFTLDKYNGQPIKKALAGFHQYTYGANSSAQKANGLEYLSSRNHRVNFIPKRSQVLLEFTDKAGQKIKINFPWLTNYNCQESSDGTLISTYDRYSKASQSGSKLFQKETAPLGSQSIASERDKNGNFLYSTYKNDTGYLKVSTFHPSDYVAFDKEMRDFLKELKKNGVQRLVIDVRNNGGGYVYLAERLVQYLTNEIIDPTQYRFKNSLKNIQFFGSSYFEDKYYKFYIPLARKLENSSDYYSETIPLVNEQVMRGSYTFQLGNQFQQIDILTNSSCYSACDMFVAQMQDHGSAKIWGIDSERTGAGGATVKSYSDYLRKLTFKMSELDTLPALPGGQDMRFSFLQSIRTKRNAGVILENAGAKADETIYFNETEIFNTQQTIMSRMGINFS